MPVNPCQCSCSSLFPQLQYAIYDGRYVRLDQLPDPANAVLNLNDSYTKLLLHFIGANLSTTIIDDSPYMNAITAVADAKIKTNQYVFGTSSLYCDGTGDYIKATATSEFDLSNLNFTIETRIRWEAVAAGTHYFYRQETDANNYVRLSFNCTTKYLIFEAVSGGVIVANYSYYWGSRGDGTWYHVGVVRRGTNFYLFIDGFLYNWTNVSVSIGTNTMPNPGTVANSIQIGNSFKGWLTEFRLSIGIGRWYTNFTLPAQYYGYITTSILQLANFIFRELSNVPPAETGYGKLYVKASDHSLYFMDALGVEHTIGGTAKIPYTEYQDGSDATGAVFTLTHTPYGGTSNNIAVYKNSMKLAPGFHYTLSGDQLTVYGSQMITFEAADQFLFDYSY